MSLTPEKLVDSILYLKSRLELPIGTFYLKSRRPGKISIQLRLYSTILFFLNTYFTNNTLSYFNKRVDFWTDLS